MVAAYVNMLRNKYLYVMLRVYFPGPSECQPWQQAALSGRYNAQICIGYKGRGLGTCQRRHTCTWDVYPVKWVADEQRCEECSWINECRL